MEKKVSLLTNKKILDLIVFLKHKMSIPLIPLSMTMNGRSHTEEPRFPCVACHMTFKTLMDMKKHREMNKCVHHVKMES